MRLRESGMPDATLWESFFDPSVVLERLHFDRAAGDVVDIGAGYGTFAITAATRTRARVVALDIDEQMVVALHKRATELGLTNLVARMADAVEGADELPGGAFGYAMLFNLLHGEEPVRLLDQARLLLAPGGLVAVTHWVSDRPTPRGPSLDIRPLPEDCIGWAAQAGLSLIDGPIDLPPYHYGLVFERPLGG